MKSARILIISVVISILGFHASHAQNADWLWAKRAGALSKPSSSTGGYTSGNDVATDANGNVYVTGSFGYNVAFDQDSFSCTGYNNMFIAKYNAAGTLLWVKKGIGALGNAIATDINGNVFVAGTSNGNVIFDQLTINGIGGNDYFIAKYDANGNILWAHVEGTGDRDEIFLGIATDISGNVYVRGTENFVPFTAKYNASGNLAWHKSELPKSPTMDEGFAVATDKYGYVYASGQHYYLGADTTFILRKRDGATGDSVWAAPVYGPWAAGISIATFDTTIYIAGLFRDSVKIGTTVLKHEGQENIFIARFDNNGHNIWTRKIDKWPDMVGDYFFKITTDAGGNIYLISSVQDSALVGTNKLDAYSSFIVKYDPAGNIVWIKTQPQSDGNGICIDSYGYIFATGSFSGGHLFGGTRMVSTGTEDMFLGRITPYPLSIAPEKGERGYGISVFPNPSKGHFTADLKNGNYDNISIFDQLGRCIYNEAVKAGETHKNISLATYAEGVYYLRASGENGAAIQKLVIEE